MKITLSIIGIVAVLGLITLFLYPSKPQTALELDGGAWFEEPRGLQQTFFPNDDISKCDSLNGRWAGEGLTYGDCRKEYDSKIGLWRCWCDRLTSNEKACSTQSACQLAERCISNRCERVICPIGTYLITQLQSDGTYCKEGKLAPDVAP